MVKRSFKSFKQMHREEILSHDPSSTMDDYIWQDDYDEFVRLKNNTIVHIHPDDLQTVFPFPYSKSKNNYEEQKALAEKTVNLDYAIQVNTQNIDFMLKCLRERPSLEYGALYLSKESTFVKDDCIFRTVEYIRTYPDMFSMNLADRQKFVFLKDLDDRKAIYSAYKRIRASIVKRLIERKDKYRHNAFETILYNID